MAPSKLEEVDMNRVSDGSKVGPHGMFYMESAGGCPPEPPGEAAMDEHKPGCFALEEERGEGWSGSGAAKPLINEARPRL
jgi:hypothetical protein